MQVVQAQSGYSSSSLNGTYSVEWNNIASNQDPGNLSGFYTGIGTIQFNGSGSITGGTLTLSILGSSSPCVYSVSGTYSLQTTALGTASLALTSTTNGCTSTTTWQTTLAAAGSGSVIEMARSDGRVASGSAFKQ